MAVTTPWGYDVPKLEPIIDVGAYRLITGNVMSSDDGRVLRVLTDVSRAVRDYCGWHVGPSLKCTYTGEGDGRLLALPALGITGVCSLSVGGVRIDPDEYEWSATGLLRLKRGRFPDEWRSVTCVYNAGFEPDSIGEVVAQIASNALVAAPGISEEHTGSVGATYNKTGDGITGGVSLLERDKALLAPYRIVRAW